MFVHANKTDAGLVVPAVQPVSATLVSDSVGAPKLPDVKPDLPVEPEPPAAPDVPQTPLDTPVQDPTPGRPAPDLPDLPDVGDPIDLPQGPQAGRGSSMPKTLGAAFAALIAVGIGAVAPPAVAQNDFGDVVSGLAQSLLAQELEKAEYDQARASNSVAGWQAFLKKYPKGAYRTQAQAALAKLQGNGGSVVTPVNPVVPDVGAATGPAAVEAGLGLSREQRRLIQRQLTSLGYDTGTPDGLWGRGTRGAITAWQRANGFNATGYVTSAEVTKIRQQAGKLTTPGDTAAADDLLEERLLGLTSAERREVQRMLSLLGYNAGRADGVFGSNTRRALAAWQRDEGERASGYITADQLRTLRSQTGG